MNIVFIFDKIAHYHQPLFQKLQKELSVTGHKVFLLSGKPKKSVKGRISLENPIYDNEQKYRYFEFIFGSLTLRLQWGVQKLLRKIKPHIIIIPGHVGNLNYWKILFYAKMQKIKIITWQCGYEYNKSFFKDILLIFFLKRFNYHLAYHSNAKKYLQQHKIDAHLIKVIKNTIDESLIKVVDKNCAKNIICHLYPSLKNKQIILYVGAILPEKNIKTLIDVFIELGKTNLALLIIGDGPELNLLKSRYSTFSSVIFTGAIIENVGIYFDASDIFVLPGTGGLAINEAMIHGLPIISTYADGSADDLVFNNYNGFC